MKAKLAYLAGGAPKIDAALIKLARDDNRLAARLAYRKPCDEIAHRGEAGDMA